MKEGQARLADEDGNGCPSCARCWLLKHAAFAWTSGIGSSLRGANLILESGPFGAALCRDTKSRVRWWRLAPSALGFKLRSLIFPSQVARAQTRSLST